MVVELPDGVFYTSYSDYSALTGASIFFFLDYADGVAVRMGGGGVSRQIDSLENPHISEKIDAFVISGGSAFGLQSANPVVKFLKEKGIGFDVRGLKVPKVPTVAIFDLGIGLPQPPSEDGIYSACENMRKKIFEDDFGSVGVGVGATIGKILGVKNSTKGGQGFAYQEFNGIKNILYVVLNPFGDVVLDGKIIAGARKSENSREFVNTLEILDIPTPQKAYENTVILLGITTAKLTREEMKLISYGMTSSLSSLIRPAHTPFDGDFSILISLQKEKIPSFIPLFWIFYKLVREGALSAVRKSKGLGGVPSATQI